MEASSTDNKPEFEKTSYQQLLIVDLKKEIEMARKLDSEKLASEIQKIGFSCQLPKLKESGNIPTSQNWKLQDHL